MKLRFAAALLVAAAVMFFVGRGCGRRDGGWCRGAGGGRWVDGEVRIETRVDTLIVRDTVRDTVLVPVRSAIVRVDTVWIPAAGDTVRRGKERGGVATESLHVALPVERKVYRTGDYRAVVEGFRPALVEMEIYRNTTQITREITRTLPPRRWGIGLQAGYGITPKGAVPYVGIGIQYSVVEW